MSECEICRGSGKYTGFGGILHDCECRKICSICNGTKKVMSVGMMMIDCECTKPLTGSTDIIAEKAEEVTPVTPKKRRKKAND